MQNLRGLTDSEGSETETTHQKHQSNQYSSVQVSNGQAGRSPPPINSGPPGAEAAKPYESKTDTQYSEFASQHMSPMPVVQAQSIIISDKGAVTGQLSPAEVPEVETPQETQ